MRRALALLVIVCAAGAGCGGDDGDDEQQVRTVVREYLKAVADGRGAPACRRLTDAAQREAVEAVTAAFPDAARVTCVQAVTEIALDTSGEQKRVLRNASIGRVTIDGDRATVAVKGIREPLPLEQVGDDWRVARGTVET